MNRIKYFLLWLVACPLCCLAQVSVDVQIDSTVIVIGQQAHVKLSVTMKEGQKADMPTFSQGEYLTPGVEIVETQDEDDVKLDNNSIRKSRVYTITSFENADSLYYLPPLGVIVDGKEYKSKNLALKVVEFPVDSLHPDQFFPPKDVQDNPFLWAEWSPLFWMSLLLLVLTIVMFYLVARLRDNKPIIAKIRFVRKMLPHQAAMKEIKRIQSSKLSSSADQKEYYTALTDTLRKYLQERFGFNAMEMTSSEIIDWLRKENDQQKIEELRQLLETADLVKFAKFSTPENEKDRGMESVVQFINETKMENMPVVEKIEPQVTEEQKRSIKSRRILLAVIAALSIIIFAVFAFVCWQMYLLVF